MRTPKGCWVQDIVLAPCSNCGARPPITHVNRVAGEPRHWCEKCCVLCRETVASDKPKAEVGR